MEPADPNPDLRDAVEPCLAAARAGSLAALGQVLELCRHYLLGVANRELDPALQAKVGASDLVQETFLEAQRLFARFQGGSRDELLAWLRAILLHKVRECTRHYRTLKRQVDREVALPADSADTSHEGALAADTSTPSSMVAQDEQTQALWAALERLPEHYRQVLIWRQYSELSFEEIARRLGKSPDAARKLWLRALERLQQEVNPSPGALLPSSPKHTWTTRIGNCWPS